MANTEQQSNPGPSPNAERLPNPEPLLVTNALLEQAERKCKQRLANDPDNRTALRSLAQIYRKQGNLSEARILYERLVRLHPEDREAEYMHAVLAGTVVPPLFRPAPFVFLKNFLPPAFHETLLPFVLSVQEKLVRAKVGDGDGHYDPDSRESLDLPGEWDVKKRFREYVSEIIPKVTPQLQVAPFEIGLVEVKVRAYMDGHFFRLHKDCAAEIKTSVNRRVSYVYFFHKMPRAYAGGELLLLDTDTVTDRYTTARFTRVVPEDNSIIFFPSPYWHSVVPVSCPSKQFVDGRFVINGHINVRVPQPVVAEATANGEKRPVPTATAVPEALATAGSAGASPS